ncbi:uncharacterized protein LOC114283142 [Camellia sinensis]|uniref:uncharacterized protein LOC114283142 n=1 Tax=Camellia sinensis TaxID=4442 RepID=UPI001036E60D|nr:uncharacterized protein LOC114283142 [Camellia sinensis]
MEQMLVALTEAMMQQQRQQPLLPPPLSVQAKTDNNDVINLTYKFMKIKPPTFFGGIESLKAETWLFEMEKLFEVFPCTETQKVLLATYTLKDEARRWWLLIRNTNGNMMWARFNEIFYEKYFPQCFRNRKMFEFQELKQGRMSVAEYEAKFTELARFAPHVVDTDYKKARKFDKGLDLDIFDQVGVLKLPTYVQVLDRSLMTEATLAAMRQNKAPTTTTTDWRGKRSGYGFRKCRFQRGVCYRASGACFRYGRTGHVVKDCPLGFENASHPMVSLGASASIVKTNAKANAEKEPLRQGRVFALVPGDLQNAETVVSGKANTIANALSRKSIGNLSCLLSSQKELLDDLEKNEIEIVL